MPWSEASYWPPALTWLAKPPKITQLYHSCLVAGVLKLTRWRGHQNYGPQLLSWSQGVPLSLLTSSRRLLTLFNYILIIIFSSFLPIFFEIILVVSCIGSHKFFNILTNELSFQPLYFHWVTPLIIFTLLLVLFGLHFTFWMLGKLSAKIRWLKYEFFFLKGGEGSWPNQKFWGTFFLAWSNQTARCGVMIKSGKQKAPF